MSEVLAVERRDAVEIWTLNRPEQANALNREALDRLAAAALRISSDPQVRAVVIAGGVGRPFCAGADLKERRGMSDDQVLATLDRIRLTFDSIDRLPKPVVAAIDGVALGGGLELALACDFRVAVEEAQLGLPEVGLAIIPGGGGTQRLTRVVGEANAKELILLCRRVSASEALRLGLVHRVAERGETALEVATALAAGFSDAAPVALSAALAAIDGASGRLLHHGLNLERRLYETTLETEDRREALHAFAEKRAPKFTGK